MKKILTAGLLAGAIMLVAGMIAGSLFHLAVPSVRDEYLNTNLFRPWNDPLMSLYFVHPFLLGLIMAWLWTWTRDIIPGATLSQKGFRFAMVYFLISIPGMVISYCSFPVSFALVMSWTVGIFVQVLCTGFLFSKMLK
jgi:hypothetical protein